MGKTLICTKCNDEITSYSSHDLKMCTCGNVFIDGGNEYTRMGGPGLEDGTYKWKEKDYGKLRTNRTRNGPTSS